MAFVVANKISFRSDSKNLVQVDSSIHLTQDDVAYSKLCGREYRHHGNLSD